MLTKHPLRITGGTALNRTLKTPGSGKKNVIRPTSDRVREALFSMLGKQVIGARVLDLFAGTGSLGIEALSRGASSAVFIDQHAVSLDLIRINLQTCFNHADVEVIRMSLAKESSYHSLHRRLAGQSMFDLIFLDPPYEKKLAEMALTMVEETRLLTPGGYAIAEERANIDLPEKLGRMQLLQKRRYGETGIWIYQAQIHQ